MLAISLSILCSTILVLLFRVFSTYKIDTFQAILFNYYTCVTCAAITMGKFPIPSDVTSATWFPYALILGFCFITGFNAVGGTVKNFNVALASIMQKMTLGFVVIFSYFFYHENITIYKFLGVVLAIMSILFTSFSSDKGENEEKKHSLIDWLMFPIAALAFSTVIDILFLYLKKSVNYSGGDVALVATLFGVAGILGTCYFIFGLLTKRIKFEAKNILGGIALGIPNFGSIIFLLKAIEQMNDATVAFTINNVGIIIGSTIFAWILYKEPLQRNKIIGVLMAILAIVLVSFEQIKIYF
jgi:drug/metabolite transporter (DMT)-like permease